MDASVVQQTRQVVFSTLQVHFGLAPESWTGFILGG